MSAFIVGYECIHRVLHAVLVADANGRLLPRCYSGPPVALSIIGRRLLEMNRAVVAAKYDHLDDDASWPGEVLAEGDTFTAWVQRYEWCIPADRSPGSLLKAVHALHYQCNEGVIEGMPDHLALFGKLSAFEADLERASRYDRGHPERVPGYMEAEWG